MGSDLYFGTYLLPNLTYKYLPLGMSTACLKGQFQCGHTVIRYSHKNWTSQESFFICTS